MSTVNANVRLGYQNAAWFTTNAAVVLLSGQIVYRSTDGQYKIGDGVTALSALTFYGGVSSGGLTVGTSTITSGTNTNILYNNNGVLGEYSVTGTGTTAVLSTSPTFTTSIITPLINPSTFLNIGNAAVAGGALSKMRVGLGTGFIDLGESQAGNSAIWFNQSTPTLSNYTIRQSGAFALVNGQAGGGIYLQVNANNICAFQNNNLSFSAQASAFGAIGIPYTFTCPANTATTLGVNTPNFQVTGSTKQWATGALATQYFNYFSANTVSFVGASTATNVYGLYVEAATAGTNATITNNYAAGFSGNINIIGTPYVSGVAGVDGSFTTVDGKTVTVTKGIITAIV
jgi:hypothetical protein